MRNIFVLVFITFNVLTGLSQSAVAPVAGNGSTINPYQIATWQNLYWISQNDDQWDKHYIQTTDITFPADINTWDGGNGWTPIGNYTDSWSQNPFTGTYNGQGNKISGLYISRPSTDYVGFFGLTGYGDNGKISNLGLENINVEGATIVGGLTGRNYGEIFNCYTTGTIEGWNYCGGLTGEAWGKISKCHSNCNVTAHDILGGFVGDNIFENEISDCYATGVVDGGNHTYGGFVGHNDGFITKSYSTGDVDNDPYAHYVGGFAGWNRKSIIDSWSAGAVSGWDYVGGFVGVNGVPWEEYEELYQCEIVNSYSTGGVTGYTFTGGFAGYNYGFEDYENNLFSWAMIASSFFDKQTAGIETEIGGGGGFSTVTGVNTLSMQNQSTFTDAGWDFQCEDINGTANVWGINNTDNGNYPFLSWQGYISEDCPLWTGLINNNWDEPGNWANNTVPPAGSSVIIPQGLTNYPMLNQNQSLTDMNIDEGTNFTLSPDITFTVEGSLTNMAGTTGLVIQSDENGTGSLIHNSPGVNGTMERRIPGYDTKGSTGWHLLASPVSNMSIAGSDFEPGTYDDFYAWDEVNYQWLNYKVTENNITQFGLGLGYLVAYQVTSVKDFAGTFHHTDVLHLNLTKTTGKGEGWHLLGNPFQSALRWDDGNWNLVNIGAGAKILNVGGSYTDIIFGSENEYIPANQGFFVQATENANNSITIPALARVHESTDYYKTEKPDLLALRAGDGESWVETWLQAYEGAASGFDQALDVPFFGGMYNTPHFYSLLSDGGRLSTNRIGKIAGQTVIPLGFKSFLNTEITISARNADSFGSETEVYLVDSKENIQVNLKETPEYTFTATANETTCRFSVLFLKSTGIDENNDSPNINIYLHDNGIVVQTREPMPGQISVYNTIGQQVYCNRLILDKTTRLNLDVPAGCYIIRVLTDGSALSKKVYIYK